MSSQIQIWHFSRQRQQALLDMLKIGSIFGVPVLVFSWLTAYAVRQHGFGFLALVCLLLTMVLLAMITYFVRDSWHDFYGFRMEENYIRADGSGITVCERGRPLHFDWSEIRTVHEFYALGYGCNLKLVLNRIGDDGLYENYLFNVDGIPYAAHIYGEESMMIQIDRAWQRFGRHDASMA